MTGTSTSTTCTGLLALRALGTGAAPLLVDLLDRGEEDGEIEGSSTIKESWMMMEGTPPATGDDGEACETAVAAVTTAGAAFSSGCCLPTGASDTTDKTKPEPFVEREKFDHRRFGVLLSAGINY